MITVNYQYKHLIWQDEIKDTFLLLKHCAVYECSHDTLRVLSFSFKYATRLKKMIVIFNEWATDDILYVFETKIENLPVIINLDATKRRIQLKGAKIKKLEELLGHKIIKYNMQRPESRHNYIENLRRSE